MGRKKNLTEAELENTQTTLTIVDANQAEAEEAELLAENPAESEVSAEISEAEPKKPRSRSRKKKEIIEVAEESKTEETVEEIAEVEETAEVEEVKKPRRSRDRKVIEEKTETVEIDQWAAIKQLSEQVALILEKNSQVKMNAPQVDLENLSFLKPQQPEPKTLFVTKFAVAASIVAVLLSVVSLSLSQSARQAALGAIDPLKQTGIAVNPRRSK